MTMGGGDLNAQITVEFPLTGTYRVIASALSAGLTGSYMLVLTEPVNLSSLPTDGRRAIVGETVSGRLPASQPVVVDGRPGQAWALAAQAGQSVAIELLSDDFDAYLYLAGPGLEPPLEDDDDATDTNSRIAVTFPESGSYLIVVSAFSSGSGGEFDLRVAPTF